MEKYRIVTLYDVNIRKGPGIVFDKVDSCKKGVAFISTEFKKDSSNVGWYKIENGWICAKYVTLAADAKAETDIINKVKTRGPRSALSLGGSLGGVTAGIVSTGLSTLGLGSMSGLATNILGLGGEDGTLTQPADSSNDNILDRHCYGVPYQLRDTIDMRMGNGPDNILGISYREAMVQAPIITFLPGRPAFLADLDEDKKVDFLEGFNSMLTNIASRGAQMFQAALTSENIDMKFFSFELDYVSYIRYVNTLCWMFAIYLGIADAEVGAGASTTFTDLFSKTPAKTAKYSNNHYGDYRLANYFAGRFSSRRPPMGSEILSEGAVYTENPDDPDSKPSDETQESSIFDILTEIKTLDEYYTDFFISPNVSYSETFQNSAKQSMLQGIVSGASDMAKELSFLLSAGGQESLRDSITNVGSQLSDLIGQATGGEGLLNRIMKGATTVISGANIVFPEIWQDSSFSRNFSIEVSLKTPYGNPESVFTDIMVPLAHWLALAAPRQRSINTYGAPFLVKFFIPGFCAVDMGIVESLTITKGGDGSAWSMDGLPLEMNLSISIKDLCPHLSISRINGVSFRDAYNMFWNSALFDYVAVQSGLDLRQTDHAKRKDFAEALANNTSGDMIKNKIKESIAEDLANMLSRSSSSPLGTALGVVKDGVSSIASKIF